MEIIKLLADLRRHPGEWVLAFPHAPRSTYKALRYGWHVDLKQIRGGTIEVQYRNESLQDGAARGDVFCRFIPTPKET